MELTTEEQKIRDILIRLANESATISYSDMCIELGDSYDQNNPTKMEEFYKELSNVAVADFKLSKSLLSVVVVSERKGYPGDGFFTLAKDKGKFNGSENKTNQVVFFVNELRSVFKFWQNNMV
ncbi:MAG: hypothetical protein COA97_05070 [Flavobacteriales bacterium]|nr:MAG: hypothetical protein COA97_05070 [Flavobacteriales bacterium]